MALLFFLFLGKHNIKFHLIKKIYYIIGGIYWIYLQRVFTKHEKTTRLSTPVQTAFIDLLMCLKECSINCSLPRDPSLYPTLHVASLFPMPSSGICQITLNDLLSRPHSLLSSLACLKTYNFFTSLASFNPKGGLKWKKYYDVTPFILQFSFHTTWSQFSIHIELEEFCEWIFPYFLDISKQVSQCLSKSVKENPLNSFLFDNHMINLNLAN